MAFCTRHSIGTQGQTGYRRVENPTYGTLTRLDHYDRSVDRREAEYDSDRLGLDTEPDSEAGLTD